MVSYQFLQNDTPLGVVDIPLVHLSLAGEEWEHWYELEPFGKLKAGSRFGSIHLKCKIGPVFTRAGNRLTASTTSFQDHANEAVDGGDEDEEFQSSDPNCLRVTLHQVNGTGGFDVSVLSLRCSMRFRGSALYHRHTEQ